MSKLVSVVRAVQAVKRHRIHTASYFSESDLWLFDSKEDSETCELCNGFDYVGYFSGFFMYLTFPYLEIIDEDTIAANVHPRCRCLLRRVGG